MNTFFKVLEEKPTSPPALACSDFEREFFVDTDVRVLQLV